MDKDKSKALGRKSKRKGANGELEFAKLCHKHGYKDARRTAQFCGKTGQAGDVEGVPGLHLEIKRCERLNVYTAYEQALRDATANGQGKIPVVAHRKNNKQWLVILDAEEFLELFRKVGD